MMYSIALPDQTVINQQSLADMARLVQQGLLTRETPVWREGWPAWTPAGQVPELRSVLGPPPPPMAMPAGHPIQTPVQPAAVRPTVPSTGRRKPGVLTYVGALILLPVAVAVGYRAWKVCAPPPDETEPPRSSPAKNPPHPVSKKEARIVLDNQRLLLEAARFRDLASSRLDDALKAYDSPACLGFLRSSEAGREAPQVWAYFFSCSLLLVGHAQDPEPIIARPPSAGLWEGQTDEGEMGLTYDEIDRCLNAMNEAAETRHAGGPTRRS